MLYLLSVILGIIEGLTEFLPVSSTAHLRIAERLLASSFAIDPDDAYWNMYTIVIQLGAILALTIVFWKRITDMVRTFPKGRTGTRNALTHPITLTLIAFVVTALPMYFLQKIVGKHMDNDVLIASVLIIGGVVMWVVDVTCKRATITDIEQMTILDAAWIGAVQILSGVFPGTSRSMCTIAAGQVFGFSRAAALEFSFLLSIPTMFVATVYSLYKTLFPKPDATGVAAARLTPAVMTGDRWLILAIGFVVSFIVAWGVIAWFLNWVRKHGFVPFAVYRIIFGGAVLIWVLGMHGK